MLGVGAKGIHIAALALGVYGIEGQGGLSAAAESGNYYELPARNVQVHVLQIVGGSATYLKIFLCHFSGNFYSNLIGIPSSGISSSGSLKGWRKGFCVRSTAMLVSGPCPGITSTSPGRSISFSMILTISLS